MPARRLWRSTPLGRSLLRPPPQEPRGSGGTFSRAVGCAAPTLEVSACLRPRTPKPPARAIPPQAAPAVASDPCAGWLEASFATTQHLLRASARSCIADADAKNIHGRTPRYGSEETRDPECRVDPDDEVGTGVLPCARRGAPRPQAGYSIP